MRKNRRKVALPTVVEPTLYDRIKEGLGVASQLIITAPLKLPPGVVAVARYIALALGVLEAAERAAGKEPTARKGTGDED